MLNIDGNIKYLDIINLEDLRLSLDFISDFKRTNFVNKIIDNPSLNYFKGLNTFINYLFDSDYFFLYDFENKKIIALSDEKAPYATLKYNESMQTFEIKLYFEDPNKKDYKVQIFESDEFISIYSYPLNVKKDIRDLSKGFEIHRFDEYGLEQYYLSMHKDVISVTREANGYTAVLNYRKSIRKKVFETIINIDTNYPLVSISDGFFIDNDFVKKIQKEKIEACYVSKEMAQKFLDDNSKYLNEITKKHLLELMIKNQINRKL